MYAIKGDTYRARLISQSKLWLDGHPIHNSVDSECCIDFSCCEPDLFTKDCNERLRLHRIALDSVISKCVDWYQYINVPVV